MTAHDWRDKKRLSQYQLAERLGISQAMVSRYERGESTPGDEVILVYAKASRGAVGPEDWHPGAARFAARYRRRAGG